MSTHSMNAQCNDCKHEFYFDLEYFDRETLKGIAEGTVCPKCGSKNWSVGDGCER